MSSCHPGWEIKGSSYPAPYDVACSGRVRRSALPRSEKISAKATMHVNQNAYPRWFIFERPRYAREETVTIRSWMYLAVFMCDAYQRPEVHPG
jgi:hypothetical protein